MQRKRLCGRNEATRDGVARNRPVDQRLCPTGRRRQGYEKQQDRFDDGDAVPVKGVTLVELCKMTGWQPHSVRGAISAIMKKKYGLEVVSERIDGERVYRVIV